MRVDSFLELSARRTPDKFALVAGSRRLTYGELDASAQRLAAGLRRMGTSRGDRVAVFLENTPEAVLAVFAALKADGVFVMINPTTKTGKLATLLKDCRATVIVTDSKRLPVVRDIAADVPSLKTIVAVTSDDDAATATAGPAAIVSFATLLSSDTPVQDWSRGIDLDLAALLYTSGSTGRPKGVMLTHRNIVSASTSITTYLENRADDVILNVLPLSFDYGLYQVLMAFQFGGTVVLERSFTYLHSVLETITRERVTGFPFVPTIAALLLQLDLSKYDFSALRYVTSTGAALPVAHIDKLRALFPHVRVYSMYGLTECKRVSYLPPEHLDTHPGSVGRGMPNEEVYIVDEAGEPLTSGVGELVVRGSNVMQGYWEQPEETAQMLRPGRLPGERILFTGDLFRMDEDGFLYFVGRRDDIIKSRGEKVSPREVEDVLTQMDGLAEAAVIGIPDAILGQAIKAIITPRPGVILNESDVLRHCVKHLEDFMVPSVIDIRDELPKTANGKRDYRALRAMCA